MILYRSARYQGYPLIENLMEKLDQKGIPYQWITEDNETKATFQWQDESVKISTVHSAKGMDAPVVIILGAESFKSSEDDLEDEEKLLYVALTRAREFLVVLYTGDGDLIPKLEEAMKLYKRFYKHIIALEEHAKRSFLS